LELKYVGLSEINGPLIVLDKVKDIAFDEIAQIQLSDGSR
jgi:V/A-type H+-transporting ATPase subunit B